jgi:D-lactate dehydrogenase
MECCFCESSCVAEGLTLSPRQRIVIAREMARIKSEKRSPLRLLKEFNKCSGYFSNETCATDGLCGLACPVKIDTGKFIKQLRHDESSVISRKTAAWTGRNLALITSGIRAMLNFVCFLNNILGNAFMQRITTFLRSISFKIIPKWNKFLPKGTEKSKPLPIHQLQKNTPLLHEEGLREGFLSDSVVYFPSCINRTMGKSIDYGREEVALTQKTVELLQRAGYNVIYPENIDNLCCGMAFGSKGFKKEGLHKSIELESALLKTSENGKYPVLFDMSPCFYTFRENCRDINLKIYDPVEFMLKFIMSRLPVRRQVEKAVIFPVCSVKKTGMEKKLLELAKLCAKEVTCIETNCCGFAGDRGFTFPELNAHGQRHLKEQIPCDCKEGYSTSRTCEIGMSEHSGGISFKSIFYLIDEVTR